MLLKNFEENIRVKGKKFMVGQIVLANNYSGYCGARGVVVKILSGKYKDTDNPTIDIYVEFEDGDEAIMSADMLEPTGMTVWTKRIV